MELIVVNTCGWLVLQLTIAWGMTRLSAHHFARDRSWMRVHSWEIEFYRRWLRVRRWKAMLPDGAPWVGGTFRKRYLDRRDSAIRQLVIETRRGEAAHWLMLGCFPIFFFWNPPWVWVVLVFYAAAANLPCVVAQRYNRYVGMRLLQHRKTHFPVPQSPAIPQCEIHFISRGESSIDHSQAIDTRPCSQGPHGLSRDASTAKNESRPESPLAPPGSNRCLRPQWSTAHVRRPGN